MVDFSSIAIFILGTTTLNSKFPQVHRTYYESRIIPIHETWSTFFPHLFFVFGTNVFDYEFLTTRCKVVERNGEALSLGGTHRARRRLPRARQVKSQHMTEIYHCPVRSDQGEGRWAHNHNYTSSIASYQWTDIFPDIEQHVNNSINRNNHADHRLSRDDKKKYDLVHRSFLHSHHKPSIERPIQVLFTANCTGEYFGMGPTCRCQEAMRYFLSQSHKPTNSNSGGRFKNVEWFLFLDDDVYIRPFSLLSLLRSLNHMQNLPGGSRDKFLKGYDHTTVNITTSKPIALVSAQLFHGPLIKPKQGSTAAKEKCRALLSVDYCFAQPAIMNRASVEAMKSVVDSNGMTSMHPIWGGSHDSLLGFTLWLYQIPTYSFGNNYLGHVIYMRPNVDKETIARQFIGDDRFVMFHRVLSMNAFGTTPSSNKQDPPNVYSKGIVPNQYDIAMLTEEEILYDNRSTLQNVDIEKYHSVIEKQWRIGIETSKKLMPMMNTEATTKVSTTSFAPNLQNLRKSFVMFTPDHC